MARLSAKTQDTIRDLTGRFPNRRSAVLPALHYAQAEIGYLPEDVLLEVADLLDLPHNTTTEVVGFYTMFDQEPVGRYKLEVCRNLACGLRGSLKMVAHLEEKLGIKAGETTADGKFTLAEVECMGACGYAPMMAVGPYFYENLTREQVDAMIDALSRDEEPPVRPAGFFEKDGTRWEKGADGRAVPTASEAIARHLAVATRRTEDELAAPAGAGNPAEKEAGE